MVKHTGFEAETYGVIGGTLWGNRGAEAMVCASIRRIKERRPGADFLLLSYYPDADRDLGRNAALPVDNAAPLNLLLLYMPFALMHWLLSKIGVRWPDMLMPGLVRRLRGCAALLDVSGISFHDGRLGVLIYNVFCIWPAMLMGVPVIHLSQARGPFRNPVNRVLSKWFLSACRHSFARGRVTAEYMSGLDLPKERWSLAADVAFSFRTGDSVTREGEDETTAVLARMKTARAAGKTVIAISPSSVVYSKTKEAGIDYVGVLARAIKHMQSLGCHVLVLPNATRSGAPGLRNNDIPVVEEIRARLTEVTEGDEDGASWVCYDLNTDGIRRLIDSCELLVTSRFHAMVAGLSLGTPVFVIGWSHKYEEVLEMFGCAGDAIDFARLDEGLLPALDGFFSARNDRRRRIVAARPAVEASSLGQFERIEGLLDLA